MIKFLLNVLWILLGGIWAYLGWSLAGIICSLTIIGIPLGKQCFKIAKLSFLPFGTDVEVGEFGSAGLVGNVIWIVFLGWELCLMHLSSAGACAVTIVGIPFALQHLKLAKLSLLPFGAKLD